MMLEKLKESLRSCPIVKFDDYHYFIHPITDGIPRMPPEVMEEILDSLEDLVEDCDLLVGPEAMGICLVVPLSLRTRIPYNIVRKRKYSLDGEVSVSQVTGYSECDMYINGISPGERVVLVDDVLSTGGTVRAVAKALQSMGVEVVSIVVDRKSVV